MNVVNCYIFNAENKKDCKFDAGMIANAMQKSCIEKIILA